MNRKKKNDILAFIAGIMYAIGIFGMGVFGYMAAKMLQL